MKVFFDTSSLFKLYHREAGTDELIQLFSGAGIATIYVADITRIEFSSVVWKKCRKREISEEIATLLIMRFTEDARKFTFVPDDTETKLFASELIGTHWQQGLRTLDSIQLASALMVKEDVDIFLTSDIVLSQIAKTEGLQVK